MVGALNWGLVGSFGWNVIDMVLGQWPLLVRAVYVLAGLSALVLIFTHKNDCRMCMAGGMDGMSAPKM